MEFVAPRTPVDLPDPAIALASAQAWAASDPQLAALLQSGLQPARALLRWGVGLVRAGRAADAVTAFRACAALAPEDALAWTNLAVALQTTGAHDLAATCLERSVELDGQQPDSWLLLGLARGRSGDSSGAEKAYRTALELAPTSSAAWKCLGVVLEQKGDAAGAIDALTRCLRFGEPDAAVHANLGRLLYQSDRLIEAEEAYASATRLDAASPHFRRMARRTRFLRDVVEDRSIDEAFDTFRASTADPEASDVDQELSQFFESGLGVLAGIGRLDAARRLARWGVERWPRSASARYLLAAVNGEAQVGRAPDEYLVESFDAFAAGFDTQLVEVLGYDVPEKIAGLVRDATAPGVLHDMLDAGCGTGLCGPLVRPLARRLVGVDLSSRMLAEAAKRGVYDELVCEEVTAFFARRAGAFDVVVAADVLIYFGDLTAFFVTAAQATRPGGWLAVSAERTDAVDSYRLNPSGRFAHSPRYVESTAEGKFEIVVSTDTTLRRDGRGRAPGRLFLFRRR